MCGYSTGWWFGNVWNIFYSRMHSEGFPFIMWGSGGWTLVRRQLVVATFFAPFFTPFFVSFFASLIPCLWGSCKTSFVLLRTRHGVYGGSCKTSFWRRRVFGGSCKTSISACPLASPCLWGKLQNLVLERVCAIFVVHICTGTCLCKLCSTQ